MESRKKYKVPDDKLRRTISPNKIKKTMRNHVPAEDFIGQKKAAEALDFGLNMQSDGYNIFVTGISGSGKNSLIQRYLADFVEEKRKAGEIKLYDFCYVYNFQHHDKPQLLAFPKGEGHTFKTKIGNLKTELKAKIAAVLSSDYFQEMAQKIEVENLKKYEKMTKDFHQIMEKLGIMIVKKDKKSTYVTRSREKPAEPMPKTEFDKLTEEEQAKIDDNEAAFELALNKFRSEVAALDEESEKRREGLKKRCVEELIKILFEEFQYADQAVKSFLEELKKFILKNIALFEEEKAGASMQLGNFLLAPKAPADDDLLPFKVNVVVDNSRQNLSPIVFESHPTFSNLFGKIKKKVIDGAYITDHTMIRAGSLMLANGGYLVVNALDLLTIPGVWDKLKRSLKNGRLEIEGLEEYLGYGVGQSLHPEPITLNVKVIVLCEPWIYYYLQYYDRDFKDTFGVKVEFDSEMELEENLDDCVRFIYDCCQEDKLLPCAREAVAKVIEYAIKLADDQKKISAQFGKIKQLVVEADYWARKEKSGQIEAGHVVKALQEQRKRVNLMETKYREYFERGIFLIETSGEKVGQVIGLCVFSMEDFSFGIPSRITARTYCGSRGVISIQREEKTGGPIHNTAVLTLSGYLYGRFGKDKPLSFSASVTFEQNYGGVEGDSGTAAKTIAIISSLSGIPVTQSLSITGSMNQMGEIQPIGRANDKIEGFYETCLKKGELTGEQGVVIPYQNVDNLMLREDIAEAVKAGKFHIYAVKTIDEALEIMTGCTAEEIDPKVNKCLEQINQILKSDKDK